MIESSNPMLRQFLSINKDTILADFDAIARQSDDALDVVGLVRNVIRPSIAFRVIRVAWILEDDDVAALNLALRQEWKRLAGSEDELVDEQMIADSNRVLH